MAAIFTFNFILIAYNSNLEEPYCRVSMGFCMLLVIHVILRSYVISFNFVFNYSLPTVISIMEI